MSNSIIVTLDVVIIVIFSSATKYLISGIMKIAIPNAAEPIKINKSQ